MRRLFSRFVLAMAGNTSRQVSLLSSCSSIATYQGHVVLDLERPLRLGLAAMRAELRQMRRGCGADAARFVQEIDRVQVDGGGAVPLSDHLRPVLPGQTAVPSTGHDAAGHGYADAPDHPAILSV